MILSFMSRITITSELQEDKFECKIKTTEKGCQNNLKEKNCGFK